MKSIYRSVLFALAPLYFYAQSTLTGTVVDAETGTPLAQVSVYFPQLEKGTTTDSDGTYTLSQLPEGKYQLVLSYLGYKTHATLLEIGSKDPTFTFQMVPSTIEMDEVILSTPFHKLQRDNVVRVEQKSLEALRSNGAITLADGITQLPGVSSISTGIGIGKPVIRGLSFNRVVTYTQGIRLENQQFGAEHGLGLNDAGFSSVEVIKGPASLLYGSDALGGVLYLNPENFAKPNTTSGDVNLNYFSNTIGYGTNAGFKTSKEKLKFLVRAGYNSHTDYETGDGQSVTNSRFNEIDLKTGIGYQSTKFKTELRYNYIDSDLGIPEEIGEQNNDRNPIEPRQEVSSHIVSSKTQWFFKKASLEATLGYIFNGRKEFEDHHHEEEEHEEHEHEEGHGAEEDPALDIELNTLSYNIQFNPHWGKVTTIFGVQGMHQKNTNFGEEILIPNAITNDFGIMALSHIHFNKSDLQLGLRYDLRSINAEQQGNVGDAAFIEAVQRDFNSINAALGYRIDLSKTILARLNVNTGFRAPNLSELASNGLHSGANRFEIGNPNLEREQSIQVDVAVEYANPHLEVYANAFVNQVDNFIFLEPTGAFIDEDPVFVYQQQDATLYGGEFGVHLHPRALDWLHLESNFDMVIGELDDDTYIPLIPAKRWTNTLRVEWSAIQKGSTKTYTFVTLQSVFDQNKVATFETPTPGYNVFHVGLGGEITVFDRKIKYRIARNNLFNRDYIDHLSRLKPDGIANIGRNIVFGLSIPL